MREWGGASAGSDAMSEAPLAPHRRGIGLMAAVTVVWIVLAARRPELTYHFAPLLAAAAWPLATRRGEAQPWRVAGPAAIGAFVVVTLTGLVLALTDHLEGPTFWNDGPALPEAVLFAAIGAAVGARVATRARAGFLGALFR